MLGKCSTLSYIHSPLVSFILGLGLTVLPMLAYFNFIANFHLQLPEYWDFRTVPPGMAYGVCIYRVQREISIHICNV